ncbi:hypothetical protein EV384_1954 [Micromonospora kangleipakensis]|uniref:Uncharacterized protein n=1 Tax=Micromonospora kangleipakensis TaxID=1077942 RepID=A0A4Q8B7B6_9ACTN|nr:hypothetical protein [Micromonospora kangleipakensis]RZU73547.1 hypothetical protein EV384_1954 [Micromonospora kangleipakensis]
MLDAETLAAIDARIAARRPIFPWSLTWAEVDPARHPFDPSTVPDVVRGLPAAAAVPGRGGGDRAWEVPGGDEWADAVSFGLVDRYGRWACGWRYSVGEGDFDCGPVGAWCCPNHSITTPDATLALVAESLVEWRRWLEDLAERFDRFLPLVTGDDAEVSLDAWERAVVHVVTVVVDRTQAESAWYNHCKQVLGWFLTVAGVPDDRHDALIDAAVGGTFASWVAPSNLAIGELAERLAAEVANRAR